MIALLQYMALIHTKAPTYHLQNFVIFYYTCNNTEGFQSPGSNHKAVTEKKVDIHFPAGETETPFTLVLVRCVATRIKESKTTSSYITTVERDYFTN